MQYVTDLHLHSKYSRAVSQQMTLSTMSKYALQKGLDILSAPDFTHPAWLKEMQILLEPAEEGLYRLREGSDEEKKIRFLLSVEISSIYKQGQKLRRIHTLVFAPSFEVVEKINKALVERGCNLNADGRPIIGLSSRDLLELILEIDERNFLIPAHVWTPHFGVYGSASGFDTLNEAFGDLSKYIYGIETGLSSDPEMNWQIPELRTRSILSFSDAHSPAKMGREATVMELKELSFESIKSAIQHQSSNENKILYTVEFFPEEGKYHYSGHRNCKVIYTPEDVSEKGIICPVCTRNLTEGVFLRLQNISGKNDLTMATTKKNEQGLAWHMDPQKTHPPYVKLVSLLEIIAESERVGVGSKRVQEKYSSMLNELGTELDILLKIPHAEIEQKAGEKVAEGIAKVRSGEIFIQPGYDGEYGIVKIWSDEEFLKEKQDKKDEGQLSLEL